MRSPREGVKASSFKERLHLLQHYGFRWLYAVLSIAFLNPSTEQKRSQQIGYLFLRIHQRTRNAAIDCNTKGRPLALSTQDVSKMHTLLLPRLVAMFGAADAGCAHWNLSTAAHHLVDRRSRNDNFSATTHNTANSRRDSRF